MASVVLLRIRWYVFNEALCHDGEMGRTSQHTADGVINDEAVPNDLGNAAVVVNNNIKHVALQIHTSADSVAIDIEIAPHHRNNCRLSVRHKIQ